MYKPLSLAAAIVVLAPATASAAWSPPTQLSSAEESNPVAQSAFGGSVLTGWLEPTAALSKGLGTPTPLTVADPYEKVWAGGLDADGNAVVLTLRRHKPVQRARAIFVGADGTRTPARTISQGGHSAAQATLDVAPDGTAVAAWAWHDTNGWRVQAAIRRPGQPRFDAPQTLSPAGPTQRKYQARPFIRLAAGDGGRAALAWFFGGNGEVAEGPLHVQTAGTDATFGADQPLETAGGYADTSLAVGPDGAVQVAWLDEHYSGHSGAPSLRVAQGTAGAPLSAPAVLSTGGKGTSSGTQVAATFSADGTATVAWAKPGANYEEGGTLEVFTRAAGAPTFGPAQTLAQKVEGLVAAGGPADSAALAWMTDNERGGDIHWTTHASLRPAAGGPFGADQQISDDAKNALWPSVAMTPEGDAIAAWVTNTSGGGSGQPTAAIFTP